MIDELINEIREDVDFLYMKHQLSVQAIQVSSRMYVNFQRALLEKVAKDYFEYKHIEPIKLDGIPVIINDNVNSYGYELVVSIPSRRFKRGEEK